ncbi:MAG: HpcH/HpaI aldolase family protein [Sciscionella sp.]
MRANRVKAALQRGEVQVGTWVHTLAMPPVARILATAGFDYVNIDMEHSAFSIETVAGLCAAALDVGVTPIVRPAGSDHHLVSRPLDNGALGVLLPHVDTPSDARAALRSVKFPPDGDRGSQPPNVHTDYGPVDAPAYMQWSNEESLVMVQIESEEALSAVDAILAVPGVDGAVVGRGDLSAALGVPGRRGDPAVLDAVDTMIAACKANNKVPGLLVQDIDEAREWMARGIRYVTFSSEAALLRTAGRRAVEAIRDGR